MADTNPVNFANLPTEKVKEIAKSMGGKAAHANKEDKENDSGNQPANGDHMMTAEEKEGYGRRDDGTFKPGSEAAKEAGHKGGLHAHGEKTEAEIDHEGRREDGTFKPGSEAAKNAGHKGGLAAAANN